MFSNGTTSFGVWKGTYTDKAGNTTERTIDGDRLFKMIRRTLGTGHEVDAGHVLSIAWTLWVESNHRYGSTLLVRFAIGAYWREQSDGRPSDHVPDYVAAKRRRKRTLRKRTLDVRTFDSKVERETIEAVLREGTYTGASVALGVSQPAISQRLRRLATRYCLEDVTRYKREPLAMRQRREDASTHLEEEARLNKATEARDTFYKVVGNRCRMIHNARRATSGRTNKTRQYTLTIDGLAIVGRLAD